MDVMPGPQTSIRLRSVSGYEELKLWVDARNAIRPDDGWSPEMLAVLRATEVDRLDLFVLDGEEVVGTAFVAGGPVSNDERTFAEVLVLPGARRRGVGSTLLDAVLGAAASRGSSTVEFFVRAEEEDAQAFLERRGFVVANTMDLLAFDLARTAPDPQPVPESIELAWLTERPAAVAGMYEVAHEVHAKSDGTLPAIADTLHDWEAFELGDPKVAFHLCSVAFAGTEVVGYGIVQVVPGSGVAAHRVTAVRPEWQRRGIGEAITRAQLGAARESGLRSLEGWTRTPAIRALVEKLGYVPRRSVLVYRKRL
jgi:mycothiol synthase